MPPPVRRVPTSRLSPVPGRRGTPTHWIITAGCGWVQRVGSPVEEVHPGDMVWFPPGEKHWHGATPTMGMTHLCVQEQLDGKMVDWLEHVSDEQYRK
jgi:quercetin dioxygenase-like cupin family protein